MFKIKTDDNEHFEYLFSSSFKQEAGLFELDLKDKILEFRYLEPMQCVCVCLCFDHCDLDLWAVKRLSRSVFLKCLFLCTVGLYKAFRCKTL